MVTSLSVLTHRQFFENLSDEFKALTKDQIRVIFQHYRLRALDDFIRSAYPEGRTPRHMFFMARFYCPSDELYEEGHGTLGEFVIANSALLDVVLDSDHNELFKKWLHLAQLWQLGGIWEFPP